MRRREFIGKSDSRTSNRLPNFDPWLLHSVDFGREGGDDWEAHLRKAAILLSGVLLLVVASGQASARTPSPDPDTILITLGTAGGPVPCKDRMQSSNLLIVNGSLYLIDAGGGVTHRIVEAGYNYRQTGKIFITHAHSDHTAGLVTLLVSQWEQQAPPIDIYGGSERDAAIPKRAIHLRLAYCS